MTKVYANLIGKWVCLNDDPDCKISSDRKSPYLWWEEGAPIFAPLLREKEHTFYELDYVNIIYLGKRYRVNPGYIQIVDE